MSDFNFSMLVDAETTSAVAGLAAVDTALDGVTQSQNNAATAAANLENKTEATSKAQADAATAANKLFAAEERLEAALGNLAIVQAKAAKTANDDADAQARLGVAIASANARAAAAAVNLDNVQRKLGKSLNDTSDQMRGQAFAVRNTGQQIGDFGLQVATGQDVARAFSQQIGQLGYAMSDLGGKAGAVGKFLVGPWGIALTIGLAVLAPFVEKLFQGSDASKKLEEKSLSLEDALGKVAFGTKAATKALEDYIETQKKGEASDSLAIDTQLRLADARLADAQATREQIRANLAKALADAQAANGNVSGGLPGTSGYIQGAADSKVAALRDQLAAQEKLIADTQATQRNLLIQRADRQAKLALDPLAKIADKYDRLEDAARRAARTNNDVAKTLDATILFYEKLKKAEQDAERERASNAKKAAKDAATLDAKTTYLAAPVSGNPRISSGFGERERPTAGASKFHPALDYAVGVGTPVKAGASGVVVYSGVIGGYGKAIVVDYGNGTMAQFSHLSELKAKAGDSVRTGDVVGLSGNTGITTGPHLDYRVRTGARFENGRVTGGKYVDPRGRIAVTGISPGDAAANADDAAAKAADDLAKSTAKIGERIGAINSQWGEQPKLVKRAAAVTDDLDDIIKDLEARKPPGFENMIADARRAKDAIQANLQKPYNDFITSQQVQLGNLQLIAAGRRDEADALGVILSLEKQGPKLTLEQRDAVLATVEAIKAQQREIDVARDKQQKYNQALGGIKSTLQDATQAFVRGDLGQLLKTPGKLLDKFVTLKGDQLFEKLFGDAFRGLQDQLDGTAPVKDASAKMAKAVDTATESVNRTVTALGNLASAADKTASAVGSGGVGSSSDGLGSNLLDLISAHGPSFGTNQHPDGGTPGLPGVSGGTPTTTSGFFGFVAEKLGKGVGLSEGATKAISGAIGKGFSGAATGTFVAGLGNALGIKLNKTGSQVGGALGSFLPIPGGDIIGSIAGGIIGNLFQKPKAGTAALTSQSTPAGITGSGKNGKAEATSLGAAVQQGIQAVADQLGGQLGNYNVSIGTFDNKYRVSTTGFTGQLDSKTARGQGLVDFGKDGADAAIAFAIGDAIKDGAVTGLSAAVAKALQSSSDINAGIKEALKVQQVEVLIGGVQGQIDKLFKTEADTAKERLRIAKQYGLDVAAVEKINGENWQKLISDTLTARTGSLQSLLDDLSTGNLAEGDAYSKRNALLGKIDTSRADALAGKDGAADTLAGLLNQLVTTSRDSFGTAGPEYSADRSTAASAAQAIIDAEKARIDAATKAQADTLAAITAGNTLTNETNDLLAMMNERLDAIARGGQNQFDVGGYSDAQIYGTFRKSEGLF